jgi:hypothetical protein
VIAGEPIGTLSPEAVQRIAAVSDPLLRNLQITQAYHDLSRAMARLTGAGANWCTVATWASKQAGQSIRREDLVAAFERLLRETPAIEESANAMVEASAPVSGYEARTLGGAVGVLWDAINPAAAFQRTSDAVGRGNRKVFEEIGAEFARFLALCPGGPPSDAALEEFGNGLRQGDPPEGQQYLREAFGHYSRAMRAESPKERAELMLLANLEIGFHEQTRLQPEIVEAMNAPVVDPKDLRRRLVAELFPDPSSRIRYWLRRLARRARALLQARDSLAEEVQRLGRLAVTANLMTLTLPGPTVLRLGKDLPEGFPDLLATIEQPELVALLASVGPAQSEIRDGARDWGDLPERMHFIADLFRTYHFAPVLLNPPFSSDQVAEIRAGRRPAGPL